MLVFFIGKTQVFMYMYCTTHLLVSWIKKFYWSRYLLWELKRVCSGIDLVNRNRAALQEHCTQRDWGSLWIIWKQICNTWHHCVIICPCSLVNTSGMCFSRYVVCGGASVAKCKQGHLARGWDRQAMCVMQWWESPMTMEGSPAQIRHADSSATYLHSSMQQRQQKRPKLRGTVHTGTDR